MPKAGKPPEEIPDDFYHRCDDLRSQASEEYERRAKVDAKDLDELERIAWFTGMNKSSGKLDQMILDARESGASWRSIAIALGESDDRKSYNRVRNRYFKRL